MQAFENWNIGLDPWILREGTYGQFSSQAPASFAVEFYSFTGLKKSLKAEKISALHLDESRYQIQAQIVFIGEDYWVIDCGLKAYCEDFASDTLKVGDFVEGEVMLSVDPFFYFQYASKDKDAPPLVYDWLIRDILEIRIPLTQQKDDAGRTFLYPNQAQEKMLSVPNTQPRDQSASNERRDYLLKASLRSGPRSASVPGLRP